MDQSKARLRAVRGSPAPVDRHAVAIRACIIFLPVCALVCGMAAVTFILATRSRRIELENGERATFDRLGEYVLADVDSVGTGLGLSVLYFIITENDAGNLTVESVPGRGTKFKIRLPLRGR